MTEIGNGGTVAIGTTTGGFSSNNVIGGTTPELRNVVAGTIRISSDPKAPDLNHSRDNAVLGNYIGVAADGTTIFASQGAFVTKGGGITIDTGDRGTAAGNTIGRTEPGAGNIIAFNDGGGVRVASGYGNGIRGNSIYAAAPPATEFVNNFRNLGIALGNANKVSNLATNDIHRGKVESDSDTGDRLIRLSPSETVIVPGGNRAQNFPVLSSATIANGAITIQGRLDSAPNTTFQIDFYGNEQMDPTGFGEGKYYLGTVSATTDSIGHVEFTAEFNLSIPNIRFITATATDTSNNTSEFSARVTVGEVLESLFVVNTTDDHDDGVADAQDTTLREAIHAANNHPGPDTIQFNIPGSGVRTIVLTHALPPVTVGVTIDGFTQPGAKANSLEVGFNGTLLIQLTIAPTIGTIPAALVVSGGNTTIRGLIINRAGLFVTDASGVAIEGNIVGLDPSGNPLGGAVQITNSINTRIGGFTSDLRNLLKDVRLNAGAEKTLVEGNYIGARADGLSNLAGLAAGNLSLSIFNSSGNLIDHNVLFGAISISGGPVNDGPLDLNSFAQANDNRLLGNFIGVGADGVTTLSFVGGDVNITGNVGGSVIERNVIRGGGVFLTSALDPISKILFEPVSNAIRANSIFQNSGLGISLDGDIYTTNVFISPRNEITRNDNSDLAVGPNNLQNYPVLSSAISANGNITIQGV
jgi:CSLREA domain-containing protein